jgi:hypothetical protein
MCNPSAHRGGIGFVVSLSAGMLLLTAIAHADVPPAGDALLLGSGPGTYEVVDLATLDAQRARQGVTSIQLGQIHSRIDLANNHVVNSTTGKNFVAAGAFDNARGISTVIQNSGNNVAIQESMIVNITLNP